MGPDRIHPFRSCSNSNFNSAQTSASLALTDVLARYISLLASTAGEYANLTGRTQVGVWDGIAAVSEHGGRWEDLMGWLAEVGEGTGRLGGLEALGGELQRLLWLPIDLD